VSDSLVLTGTEPARLVSDVASIWEAIAGIDHRPSASIDALIDDDDLGRVRRPLLQRTQATREGVRASQRRDCNAYRDYGHRRSGRSVELGLHPL